MRRRGGRPRNVRPQERRAGLPGVRAKHLAGNPDTRRSSDVVTLPPDWSFTTGGFPDKSVEIYVVAGSVKIGEFLLEDVVEAIDVTRAFERKVGEVGLHDPEIGVEDDAIIERPCRHGLVEDNQLREFLRAIFRAQAAQMSECLVARVMKIGIEILDRRTLLDGLPHVGACRIASRSE